MQKVWPVPDWSSKFCFKHRPRSFGSPRSKGRLHAGCDLYAPLGSPVLAITSGQVIASGKFYMGTYEVTINHGDLGIIRYGEITLAPSIKIKKYVEPGEVIGHIASLGGGIPPMLHIEQFEGTQTGRLSDLEALPYMRRSDLIDCTPLLEELLCLRSNAFCTRG